MDYEQNLTKTVDNVDKIKKIFKNDTLIHRNLLPQLTMNGPLNQYQNLAEDAHETAGPIAGVWSSLIRL